MVTCSAEGAAWLSTLTSAKPRCRRGSYTRMDGQVASPDRRKPKKHKHAAAQSIFSSRMLGSACHTVFTAARMDRVIGRRQRELAGVHLLRAFKNVLDPWYGWDVGAVHTAADLTMADGGEVAFDGAVGQVLAMQVRNEEEEDLRHWKRGQSGVVAEREVAPYAGLLGFAS